MHLARLFSATLAVLLLADAPASAWPEVWDSLETRVPFSDGEHGMPQSIRFSMAGRYGDRYPGLGKLLFRIGPIWELHPNVLLATHLTSATSQTSPGVFEQEHRAELEPTVHWGWGSLSFNDRSRLEYRYRPRGTRWRYRNQVRVSYQAPGASWGPYLGDEGFWDLSGEGFSENRAVAGVGLILNASTQLNVGLMGRSRRGSGGGWNHDLVTQVAVSFRPRTTPVFVACTHEE